jgi:hypothetical protein
MFSGGAATVAGAVVAVFADSPAGLGAAVDLAERHGADQLCFFCEANTPDVARRAAQFRLAVTVLDPDGDFAPLAPAPPPASPPVPPALDPAAARMRSAGLEVVWEHGILRGEWLGLEVARASDAGGLEVGVGQHDRDANRDLFPEGAPDGFLDQAVAIVRELRRPGALPHPANRLARERWLRAVVVAHPEMVGLGPLQPAPAPAVRADLTQRAVAPAWAPGAVAVFSVGVDPDAVPQGADARLQSPGLEDLVLVVPAGDDHPLTRRLAAALRRPAGVVTVPPDWASVEPP